MYTHIYLHACIHTCVCYTGTDCSQNNLLHLASQHGLTALAQYLTTLPGASQAVCQPNEQGLTPVDVAREKGYEKIVEVFSSIW